jgi:hypothetical protein
MNANKIELNGEVLLDLTEDTVTEADVAEGKTFHKADGNPATGTASGANIGYGDTAPEDTTKLWAKTSKAKKVIATKDLTWENGNRPHSVSPIQKGNSVYAGDGSVCTDGEFIYSVYGNKVYKHNIETGERTTICSLSSYAYCSACGVIDSKLYIFGGSTSLTSGPSNNGYVVDLESSVVSELATKYKIKDMGYVCVGSKLHMFGGSSSNASSSYYQTQHAIYDPETDTMSTAASLTGKTVSPSCAAADNAIFILGGVGTNNNQPEGKKLSKYDIESDVLSVVMELPQLSYGRALCCDGRKLYMICGQSHGSSGYTNYTTIDYYDLDSGEIVRCMDDCGTSGRVSLAMVRGDKIIFVKRTNSYLYEYAYRIGNPSLENGVLQIIQQLDANIFTLINNDTIMAEIGVKEVYKGNENNEAEPVESAIYQDGAWTTI